MSDTRFSMFYHLKNDLSGEFRDEHQMGKDGEGQGCRFPSELMHTNCSTFEDLEKDYEICMICNFSETHEDGPIEDMRRSG